MARAAPLPPHPTAERRGAVVATVAGAATWGTTGTAQALAALDAPVAVGAARVVGGAVALALAAAVVSRPGRGRRAGTRPPTVPVVTWVVAGLAVVAYQLLFFAGVARAGVAVGTVVGIGSVPVFAGALAWAVDRTVPEPRWWVASAVAVLGCALVVAPSAGSATVEPVGVLLAAGAGLAYAVLTVVGHVVLAGGASPTVVMAKVFAIASVPAVAVLVLGGAGPLLTARGAALVGWLSVVTVAVGYLLYARGLRTLRPTTVGTLTLTEPLVAASLGLLVLGERPGGTAALGAALLTVGLVLVATRRPGTAPLLDLDESSVGDPSSER